MRLAVRIFWALAGVTVIVTLLAIVAVLGVFEMVTMDVEDIFKYWRYSVSMSLYSTWASLFLINHNRPRKI